MIAPRMHLKTGHFYCEAILEFVRELPCFFCGKAPPSAPHHHPPKGMGGGLIDDSKVVPVCVICHKRVHGMRVETASGLRPPIPNEQAHAAVDKALRRFLFEASRERLDDFADALNEHRAKRGI